MKIFVAGSDRASLHVRSSIARAAAASSCSHSAVRSSISSGVRARSGSMHSRRMPSSMRPPIPRSTRPRRLRARLRRQSGRRGLARRPRRTAKGFRFCTSRPTTCSTAPSLCLYRRRCAEPANRLWPDQARRRGGGAGDVPGADLPHRLGYSPYGQNFVKTMCGSRPSAEFLRVVDDQTGNPTSAHDMRRPCWKPRSAMPAQRSPRGIYHLAATQARRLVRLRAGDHAPCRRYTVIARFRSRRSPAPNIRRLRSVRPIRGSIAGGSIDFGLRLPRWQDSLAAP